MSSAPLPTLNPVEALLFRIARRRIKAAENPATLQAETYSAWRHDELQREFESAFNPSLIKGSRVLDFGCGTGKLSFLAQSYGAARVFGFDLYANSIRAANDEVARRGLSDSVSFRVGEADRIDLPDSSIDVILCFDVLEHIMAYRKIIPEWARVLAPRGQVWVHWSPYRTPYGHHWYGIIEVPWIHLIFRDHSMYRVAAHIYEEAEFHPRAWHRDERGNRVANPYLNGIVPGYRNGYLNRLGSWRFERECRTAGLRVKDKKVVPFSGGMHLLKAALSSIPYIDCFTSTINYRIERG